MFLLLETLKKKPGCRLIGVQVQQIFLIKVDLLNSRITQDTCRQKKRSKTGARLECCLSPSVPKSFLASSILRLSIFQHFLSMQSKDVWKLCKRDLEGMNEEDLRRKIADLKALISVHNHKNKQTEHKKALRGLQKDLKQKQISFQSITDQLNQYFSGRHDVITKNKELSIALHQLRTEFNEEMYKMENIKLMLAKKPNQEQDTVDSSNTNNTAKLSEIEKLKKSHHQIFAEISSSFLPQNESTKIDGLLSDRTQLLCDIVSIHKQCQQLHRERTSSIFHYQIYGELLHILEGIQSIRALRTKREEVLAASIGHRRKQEINAEIVEAKRVEQRENLEEKLKGIEEELEEFTNLNAYGSPSVSVRGSVNLKDWNQCNFDNLSVLSDASQLEMNQMMESKQTVHSLIQYLQDFLPLTMRKQIETLKMKAMSDGNEQEIETAVKEMTSELQQMRPGGEKETMKGGSHWYLNHNMSTFDEFDHLDIKIPLILSDIPEVIKVLLDRIRSIQHMNKCFAIV